MAITEGSDSGPQASNAADDVGIRGAGGKGVRRRGMPRELAGDAGGTGGRKIDGETTMVSESRTDIKAGNTVGAPSSALIGGVKGNDFDPGGGNGLTVVIVGSMEALPRRLVRTEGGRPE